MADLNDFATAVGTLIKNNKGEKGDKGDPGPYGGTEVTDPQVASWVGDASTQTGAAVSMTAATHASGAHRTVGILQAAQQDASILVVTDSTGNEDREWVHQWLSALGVEYQSWSIASRLWDDAASAWGQLASVQTGNGPTLTVYNAAVAGAHTTFWSAARYNAATAGLAPDLVVVALGHNEGSIASLWHSQYVAFTETITGDFPDAEVLLIAQNPATGNTYQQQRRDLYRAVAAHRGYGFVDVCQAFVDTGDAAGLTIDGIHPNADGTALWVQTLMRAFARTLPVAPRVQGASTLTEPGLDVLANGDFAAFTEAVPDGWVIAGSATTAQETSVHESPHGYAVKVTSQAAGGMLTNWLPIERVRGQWLTLAARVYVPEGAASTAGRIALNDSTGTTVTNSTPGGQGAYRWVVVTRKIPADAAYARVMLYGDSAGGGGFTVYDRAYVTLGRFPHQAAAAGASTGGGTNPVAPWVQPDGLTLASGVTATQIALKRTGSMVFCYVSQMGIPTGATQMIVASVPVGYRATAGMPGAVSTSQVPVTMIGDNDWRYEQRMTMVGANLWWNAAHNIVTDTPSGVPASITGVVSWHTEDAEPA